MASDSSQQMSNPIKSSEIMKGTFSIRIQDWLLHINFFYYIFLVTLIVTFLTSKTSGGGALEPPCPSPCYGPDMGTRWRNWTFSLHTVKFELTNQHSVGGKNCVVVTPATQILCCSLRFLRDQQRLYCGHAVLLQRFLKINRLPYFNLLKVTTVCNYMNWINNQNRFKTFFCGGRLR